MLTRAYASMAETQCCIRDHASSSGYAHSYSQQCSDQVTIVSMVITTIDIVLRAEAAYVESAQVAGLGNAPMCSGFLWSRCRSCPW